MTLSNEQHQQFDKNVFLGGVLTSLVAVPVLIGIVLLVMLHGPITFTPEVRPDYFYDDGRFKYFLIAMMVSSIYALGFGFFRSGRDSTAGFVLVGTGYTVVFGICLLLNL